MNSKPRFAFFFLHRIISRRKWNLWTGSSFVMHRLWRTSCNSSSVAQPKPYAMSTSMNCCTFTIKVWLKWFQGKFFEQKHAEIIEHLLFLLLQLRFESRTVVLIPSASGTTAQIWEIRNVDCVYFAANANVGRGQLSWFRCPGRTNSKPWKQSQSVCGKENRSSV